MEFETRPVRSMRPLAGYVGGKKLLAARVIERLGEIPHELYAEPFVGMGGVFLRRPVRAKVEAINDRSRDIAILFRVVQRHYQAFLDMMRWQLASRAEFERLNAQEPDSLTDLERAARFLFLQRNAYGGKVDGRTFGTATTQPARFDMRRLGPQLEALHERLAGVWIDCRPWAEFIARWDRTGTLFYLDPPYWGTEDHYGRGLFDRVEFAGLAEVLRALKGRFVLTLNDVPEIRDLFAWASLEPVELRYFLAGGGGQAGARELIITGPGS